MYIDFFDLNNRPFAVVPDPDFMFWSAGHKRTFDKIKAGVSQDSSVTVMTGETGAGKTLLIDTLRRDPVFQQTHQILLMTNLFGDPAEIQQRLMHAFGAANIRIKTNQTGIPDGLAQIRKSGLTPVIVADEAQSLSSEGAQELVRLASDQASGPVPILLVGRSELENMLQQKGYEHLLTKTGEITRLSELSVEETKAYITARLARAGAKGDPFTNGAATRIHETANGLPGSINKLCETLLYLAAQENLKVIDTAEVQRFLKNNIDPDTLAIKSDAVDQTLPAFYLDVTPRRFVPSGTETRAKTKQPFRVTHPLSVEVIADGEDRSSTRSRRMWWGAGSLAIGLTAMAVLYPSAPALLDGSLSATPGALTAAITSVPQDPQNPASENIPPKAKAQQAGTGDADGGPALETALLLPQQEVPSAAQTQPPEPATPGPPTPLARDETQLLSSRASPIAPEVTPEAEAFFAEALNSSDAQLQSMLFARAALRGHGRAALYLGQLFETGDGVSFAPDTATSWYDLSTGEAPEPLPDEVTQAGAARPLFSAAHANSIEFSWDGPGTHFIVELANAESQLVGWFETRLTAAYLDRPDAATQWRVASGGAEPGAWHPIGADNRR